MLRTSNKHHTNLNATGQLVRPCGCRRFLSQVHELAAAIRSGDFTWEELSLDDADIRLKWAGLFHRRKRNPGTFMMRVKVKGRMMAAFLRFIPCLYTQVGAGRTAPAAVVADVTQQRM